MLALGTAKKNGGTLKQKQGRKEALKKQPNRKRTQAGHHNPKLEM